MTRHPHDVEVENFARRCVDTGQELLSPRQAARLFGVTDAAVRTAASDGRVHPVFVLDVRKTPLYRLADLAAYFTRSEPDADLLTTMRRNGIGCHVSGAGEWLLLSEEPGLQRWEDATRGGDA